MKYRVVKLGDIELYRVEYFHDGPFKQEWRPWREKQLDWNGSTYWHFPEFVRLKDACHVKDSLEHADRVSNLLREAAWKEVDCGCGGGK